MVVDIPCLYPYISALSPVRILVPQSVYLYPLGGLVLYSTIFIVDIGSMPSKGP
jgi:hypothetical protein